MITYGTMLDNVLQAAEILSKQGIETTVLRLLTIAPLNMDTITSLIAGDHVLIVEETNSACGIAKELSWHMQNVRPECKVHALDLGSGFVTHGSLHALYSHYGLDGGSIAEFVRKEHFHEN